MSPLFVDTCAVIYLYEGIEERFSKKAKKLLETHQIFYSPMVILELKYLQVSQKISDFRLYADFLDRTMLARESQVDFSKLINCCLEEDWTRDLFDRMIVAQARMQEALLLSSDRRMSKAYELVLI